MSFMMSFPYMYIIYFNHSHLLLSFPVPISLLLTPFPFSMSLIRIAYRRVSEGVFTERGYLSGGYTPEVQVPFLETINYV